MKPQVINYDTQDYTMTIKLDTSGDIKLNMTDYEKMNDSHTYVPEHMRDGFRMWIEQGIYPGSFGTAVLENDLKGAFGRADDINKNHIGSIVAWFYNYAPSGCWGSRENVNSWAEKAKGEV